MLVDCHSNWTAMAYHYRAEGREPDSLQGLIALPVSSI